VRLEGFRGVANHWVCSCASPPKNVGFAGVWHEGRAKLQLQRSVLERYAPAFIAQLEAATSGAVSRGGCAKGWDAEVLQVLGDAYRHAAGRGSAADLAAVSGASAAVGG